MKPIFSIIVLLFVAGANLFAQNNGVLFTPETTNPEVKANYQQAPVVDHSAFDLQIPKSMGIIDPNQTKESNSMFDYLAEKERTPDHDPLSTPITFNWDQSNMERFRNSPCFGTLGFDPNMDPQLQEQRYKECESSNSGSFQNNWVVLLVVVLFVVIVLFALSSIVADENSDLTEISTRKTRNESDTFRNLIVLDEKEKLAILCSFLFVALSDTSEDIWNVVQISRDENAESTPFQKNEWDFIQTTVRKFELKGNFLELVDTYIRAYGQLGVMNILSKLPEKLKDWYINSIYELIFCDGAMNNHEKIILDDIFKIMGITEERIQKVAGSKELSCFKKRLLQENIVVEIDLLDC